MRKLEDYWRISDKRNVNSGISELDFGSGEEEEEGNDSLTATLTNHDRAFYMQELPLTEEQQEEAHRQIAEALYNVGFIYLDRLSDYHRSIDAYEQLNKRYPGNEKELPSWYALYKMYKDLGNEEESERYKNMILTNYPESSYANFILDPDFYKKLEEESRQASVLYSKTYEAFQQGQYYRVRMNVERAMELYPADTAFTPRFALLDALSRGRLESIDTMAYALLEVVRNYPRSAIRNYAMDLLQYVNEEYHVGIDLGGMTNSQGEIIKEEPQSPYVYEPNTEHLVIIVFSPRATRVEPLKVRISDFNKREYRLKEFEVKNLMLSNEMMIVSLSVFNNEQEAKDYITSMFLTDYIFGGIDTEAYDVLPISSRNYATFYQERKVDEYKAFLEENSK